MQDIKVVSPAEYPHTGLQSLYCYHLSCSYAMNEKHLLCHMRKDHPRTFLDLEVRFCHFPNNHLFLSQARKDETTLCECKKQGKITTLLQVNLYTEILIFHMT